MWAQEGTTPTEPTASPSALVTEQAKTPKSDAPPPNEIKAAGKEEPKHGAKKQSNSREAYTGSSIIPWIIVALLAAATGALAMWVFIMKKQGAHLEALRKRVLDGGEKIPLLSEEALILLSQFRTDLKEGVARFESDLNSHQAKTQEILQDAKRAADDTQTMTKQLVEDFKERVQKHLDKVVGYMQRIADSSAGANESANKTMEYSKQVTESLRARDQELAELKKGYQLSMLAPLVQGILAVRDELINLEAVMSLDEHTRNQLNDFNQSILESLNTLGIHQLEIGEGHDLNDIELHKWDPLEVSRSTKEPHLDRKVAEVIKHGYVIRGPHAHDTVVRKAQVIRYKFTPEEQSEPLVDGEPSGADNNQESSQESKTEEQQ